MKINLKMRLALTFLILGISPVVLMSFVVYKFGKDSLIQNRLDSLDAVEKITIKSVNRYLKSIENQIITFANNKMVVDSAVGFKKHFANFIEDNEIEHENISRMKHSLWEYYQRDFADEYKRSNPNSTINIRRYFDNLSDIAIALQYHYIKENHSPLGEKDKLDFAPDLSDYSKLHKVVHPIVRDYLKKFGYYDIFIVDAVSGHIMYSVFKELDFATSLKFGPYSSTNIAKVFKLAIRSDSPGKAVFADYEQYLPSYNAPASFIAAPILESGKTIAVAIFQMPIDTLNGIMGERNGRGKTGESFLVGEDLLPRSNSLLEPETYNVVDAFKNPGKAQIDLQDVRNALAGKDGRSQSINYLGTQVLSSYGPIEFLGTRWAILSQISMEEALSPVVTLVYVMAIVALIASLAAFAVGIFMAKGISTPILSIASQLQKNSDQVGETAEQLSQSSIRLAELASEQANSITETAASLEEISSMVSNNVEQAELSEENSNLVKSTADKGNTSMKSLIESMAEIIESNTKIQELVKVIDKIGDKTEVIDEIVFQTKLLSFNASVEAERAGEHGRGFAVVAQEIGNLAQMSGVAALEIAQLVKNSIKNTESITSENKKRVDSGNNLVQETAKYLAEIALSAEKLSKQSSQIVTASKEQSDGVSQINDAMAQIDQATQQNSATAESSSKAGDILRGQSQNLAKNVKNLLAFIHGNRTPKNRKSLDRSKPADLEKKNSMPTIYHQDVIPLKGHNKTIQKQSVNDSFDKKVVGGDQITLNESDKDGWEKI